MRRCDHGPPRYHAADYSLETRTHCGIRFALPRMIPRARETTCCILLIIFVSYLSHKQLHVCFRVRAILCSPIFASGQPPLEATPSLMAERMNVVSYVYNLFLFLRFLFGVNVLGSRCSLFSRFFLFDFPDCASKKRHNPFSRPSITGWCLVFSSIASQPVAR